jgi:ABC-type multidrug transport system fused ATPase/permease subunit
VRGAVVVVTQDALFFTGDLRANLDPFGEFSDGELSAALGAVGFSQGGAGAALELGAPVGERGAGLSAGQAQLVSLARALLRRPRLLVLDEATASLDIAAEEVVLRALRRGAFEGVSCLVIAHRLQCVVECDAVVVMEGGEVVEAGAPWDLLEGGGGGGAFAALVAAAPASVQQGLRDRARHVALG